MIRKSGIRNEFEIHDLRFLYLTLPNTWVERLYTGSLWAEGPVYFADGDYLLWSDIPNNRMLRWAGGQVSIYRDFSNNSNGNTRDRQGRRRLLPSTRFTWGSPELRDRKSTFFHGARGLGALQGLDQHWSTAVWRSAVPCSRRWDLQRLQPTTNTPQLIQLLKNRIFPTREPSLLPRLRVDSSAAHLSRAKREDAMRCRQYLRPQPGIKPHSPSRVC
jgi:hypothetical protein